MGGFEQAFDDTEKAANSVLESATALAKLARRLQKAAREGNINAIKKARVSLGGAMASLTQTVTNAVETWPFVEEEEEKYLQKHYADELCDVAAEKGVSIHERDGVLISFPSVVRILPKDRAVRIDKSKQAILRPSRLTEMLAEQQKKPPRFKTDAFLNSLHKVYSLLTRTQSSPLLTGTSDPVVPLVNIYEALTSLPGSSREYSRIDFAREIYLLEDSGALSTKVGGSRASFPSSTGTKRAKDTFTFVNPDGQVITYYGIQFSGGE